jgi:steroid delta-isomerase-like uncharacterized protein
MKIIKTKTLPFILTTVLFLTTGTETKAQPESVTSAQFTPDGRHIITTSSNGTARLWGMASGQPLVLQQNGEIIRRYFEEWANHGNAAVADELIATNLLFHSASTTMNGLAEYKTRLTAFHAAFPDLHYTVADQINAGEKVVVRWTLRATQAKEYQGHPPNGKTMTVTGISIFRLASGKIQEIWVNMDRLGQMEQLGWLPASRAHQ